MTRERLLGVISGQMRLIGSLRVSLHYYSGQEMSEADDSYRDAAVLQKKALRSNRRVRKLLREEGRNV